MAYNNNQYQTTGYGQTIPFQPPFQQQAAVNGPIPIQGGQQNQTYQQAQQQQVQKSPYKYPKEAVVVEREDINFYAELCIVLPTEKELMDGKFPGMDAYGKSRFDLFLFKKNEKKSLKYCVDVKTVKLLELKTKALISNSILPKAVKSSGDVPLTPAYTVRLKGTQVTGKTAAEILIEDPNARNSLLRQRDYYMQNANHPKYGKNNREMIDAINEAVTLFDQKQLRKDIVLSSSVELLNEIKTPDISKKDQRGLTKARQLRISYSDGSALPYSIEIMNCMAPPSGGIVGANLSQAQDVTKWSINLSEAEWMHFISELTDTFSDIREMTKRRRYAVYASEPNFFSQVPPVK